jgi:hypothetical protein
MACAVVASEWAVAMAPMGHLVDESAKKTAASRQNEHNDRPHDDANDCSSVIRRRRAFVMLPSHLPYPRPSLSLAQKSTGTQSLLPPFAGLPSPEDHAEWAPVAGLE